MFDDRSYTQLPPRNWQTVGDYQQWALAFYVSRAFTPIRAAAIVGNLSQESGMNPDARRPNDAGPGLDSVGIGQWNKSRLDQMLAFVHAVIGEATTVQGRFYAQLAFSVFELWTTMTHARGVLESSSQDETLAGAFGKAYEGFGDASVPQRNAYAKAVLAAYDPTRWA